MTARLALVALAAAALAAPAAGSGARTSGVYGIVRKGPTTPVCRVGSPCAAPTRATLVFSRSGVREVVVRSGADGRYRAVLRPGRYAVSVRPTPTIGRGLEPRTVVVPSGRFARVDFLLDTGIR